MDGKCSGMSGDSSRHVSVFNKCEKHFIVRKVVQNAILVRRPCILNNLIIKAFIFAPI